MIDLRSDTVTQPSVEMLAVMAAAETGDDVYGEDPTINRLETLAASMMGKEAALFVPSGTMSNLLALLCHCERGDEYIAGQDAHTYLFEAGGGAVLGSIQPQPLPFNDQGELPLDQVAAAIKPDDSHFAMTRLLCLENTQAGKVLSLDYLQQFADLAADKGLATHLDGARVFNAAVKLEVPVTEITRHFDTVSFCLSKGLAAPVGSLLVGDSRQIAKAHRWRKMLGGGMRQAGVLAAAGIYALENHVERLAEDHQHTTLLAEALENLPDIPLAAMPETNMLHLALSGDALRQLQAHLTKRGIIIRGARWVLHRDVTRADLDKIITTCQAWPGAS